jgi:succinate-acetate transporter protein
VFDGERCVVTGQEPTRAVRRREVIETRTVSPATPTSADGTGWLDRTRIVLTPTAAPSIMGLYGFAITLVMVGSWQAGWYGGPTTPTLLWPFVLAAGGVLQAIAAVAALRARDGVAVAAHTASGSFWIGWSLLQLLAATRVVAPLVPGTASAPFAFWFIAVGAVIAMVALAAPANSFGLAGALAAYAAASGISAAGWYGGSNGLLHLGGWFMVVAAGLAWYTATALMLQEAYGRTILPLLKPLRTANIPGAHPTAPIAYPQGMPGARVGQ